MMVEIQNELENNGKIEIGKERESHDVLQKKKFLENGISRDLNSMKVRIIT